MGKSMYRNYIFDLYGTLVDIHTDEERDDVWEKLSYFYGYYDARYTPCELKASYKRLASEAQKKQECNMACGRSIGHEGYPEIQIETIFERLFTQKGVQPKDSLIYHSGQLFRVLSTDYIRLYEGANEMMQRLKAKGRRIYLLSNAQKLFTEYELRLLGIASYFDGVAISSEYGVKKPDIRFFRQFMDMYGLHGNESVMIGNDFACDIEGAANAGLDAYYIHSNISPQPDAEKLKKAKAAKDIPALCETLRI